jgi:hypothetical protein
MKILFLNGHCIAHKLIEYKVAKLLIGRQGQPITAVFIFLILLLLFFLNLILTRALTLLNGHCQVFLSGLVEEGLIDLHLLRGGLLRAGRGSFIEDLVYLARVDAGSLTPQIVIVFFQYKTSFFKGVILLCYPSWFSYFHILLLSTLMVVKVSKAASNKYILDRKYYIQIELHEIHKQGCLMKIVYKQVAYHLKEGR